MNQSLAKDVDETGIIPPRPAQSADMEMDITPMIDITFLLLIFFLVASRMDIDTNVSLPPARHGVPVSTRNAVILTMSSDAGGNVQIYKGDGINTNTLIEQVDSAAQVAEIQAYVRGQLEAESTTQSVLVKASRGLKHRDVSRVAHAVGGVNLVHQNQVQLHIAVLETQ